MDLMKKDIAIKMRKSGEAITTIAERLRVAKSTAYLWTACVPLSKSQRNVIRTRRSSWFRASQVFQKQCRDKRTEWQHLGRIRVKSASPLYLFGCALYWGEGSKSRNSVRMSNADVHLLKVFCKFIRTEFDVPTEKITFRINYHGNHVHSISELEKFWLKELDLPKSCARKHTVFKKNEKQSPTNHRCPYGIGYVGVNDTSVANQIFGSIKEMGGFEAEDWEARSVPGKL